MLSYYRDKDDNQHRNHSAEFLLGALYDHCRPVNRGKNGGKGFKLTAMAALHVEVPRLPMILEEDYIVYVKNCRN